MGLTISLIFGGWESPTRNSAIPRGESTNILDRGGGNGVRFPRKIESGGVAERLKAPVLKTGIPATGSWVRIPPPPLKKGLAGRRDSGMLSRHFESRSFRSGVVAGRWPSGRRRRTANALYGQKLYRGFESLPLRSLISQPRFPPGLFVSIGFLFGDGCF